MRPSRTGSSAEKSSAKGGGGGGEDIDALNRRLAWLPQTDLGNVERFVARWGDRLKWCPEAGCWFYWTGVRWSSRGADGYVLRAENATVRAIQDEAKAVMSESETFVPLITHASADGKVVDLAVKRSKRADAKQRKKQREDLVALAGQLRAWGRKSEQASRLSPISKRAKGNLEVHIDEFDVDKFLINMNNGTLVVRRPKDCPEGEPLIVIKPHDPADLITKISPVDFDPDATCDIFDRFLLQVQPEAQQRRFIMQWHGLSLTGDVGEQRLVVYWGKGRNGKGVLMETCAYIGGDYAESVPVETFLASPMQKAGGAATPDLAKLPGVRFLRTGEPEKGAKLGEALIKRVTGGDPIDARHLNEGFFTFFAQFKLTIACNYKPKIGGTDEGIWGRMTLVPWNVFIPEEQRDQQLGAKLRKEASGILNRLLDGLRDWLEHGLVLGDEIKAATAKYRRDSDDVGRFLDDCTVADASGRVQSSVLHETYLAWAKCNGGPTYSAKGFTGILDDRGYDRIKDSSMFWTGIKLVRTINDFVDHEGKPLVQSTPKTATEAQSDDELAF